MAWIGGSHNDMVVNAPGMKHLKSLQMESDNPAHRDLDTKNPDMPTLRSPHAMSRFIDRPHDAMVAKTPNVMHVKPRPSAALLTIQTSQTRRGWNRSHPLDRFPSVGDEVGDGENEEDEKAVARFRNSDDTLSTFSSRQRLPEKA
ncbi:hypothetical protein A0H81_10108 [Grifola frondosa]|uniref:Uncharacterized protein n=1 Tax=Grifola frondosa TaxID=5627 RepID=A0A1C7LYT8_GRIFR|nr:hypothetical protein A0H81_10108 [Grifola frondosa]